MTSQPGRPLAAAQADDDSWLRKIRQGHQVELIVYGRRMQGRVHRIRLDSITVRIPVEEQSGDVRRFSVTGTAVLSLEGAAASVPVSGQSNGEFIRLQFIGPPEIIQRRMHVRVPLDVPVALCWQTEAAGPWNWAESRTKDISVGGMRVAAARVVWPSIGDPVQVSIEFREGTVQERAEVVGKTADYDLRLIFVEIKPRTRAIIRALGG